MGRVLPPYRATVLARLLVGFFASHLPSPASRLNSTATVWRHCGGKSRVVRYTPFHFAEKMAIPELRIESW